MQTQFRRFADALADALRARGVDPSSPFTVAEIYQDLVPYRTHRDALGVEMNGDYEHLLLRLLGGEGDVLALQSEAALEQIRDELDSQNPNTGLYREFAAVDVKLVGVPTSPAFVEIESEAEGDSETAFFEGRGSAEAGTSEPEAAPVHADEPPAMEIAEIAPTSASDSEPEAAAAEDAAAARSAPPADGTGQSGEPCQWCRQVLPDREDLNFCPFCGTDLRIVPCAECGEALEPGWRFCVSCGEEVASEG